MIPYGKTKRKATIHPHNECSICSDQSFNKKTARQKLRQETEEEVSQLFDLTPEDNVQGRKVRTPQLKEGDSSADQQRVQSIRFRG